MKSFFSIRTILVITILTALAVISAYYFLFRAVEATTLRTSDLQNQIEEEANRESYLISLKTVLADVHKEVVSLNTRMVPADGAVAFLDRLESLGKFAGVKVITDALAVESLGGVTDSFVEQITVSVSAEGSYSSVRYFLDLIEGLPYSITIPLVTFERLGGEKGKSALWKTAFKLTVLKHK